MGVGGSGMQVNPLNPLCIRHCDCLYGEYSFTNNEYHPFDLNVSNAFLGTSFQSLQHFDFLYGLGAYATEVMLSISRLSLLDALLTFSTNVQPVDEKQKKNCIFCNKDGYFSKCVCLFAWLFLKMCSSVCLY